MQIHISQDAQEKFQKLTPSGGALRLCAEFLGGCGADTDFSLTFGAKEKEDNSFSFDGFEILMSKEVKDMVANDLYIKLNSMNGFQLSTRNENLTYNLRIS
jgi:Fe-S cluster assembly iron-binding protein IscA